MSTCSTPKSHHCPTLACFFSYAAYAKTLVSHLNSINLPVHEGLTDAEFNSIESLLSFTFPPDLRTVLQEGVPVGHGFPDWRSSSLQLRDLSGLPRFNILKRVSDGDFWCSSWCEKPDSAVDARAVVERLLDEAPALVPIYGNCYVASTPDMAGNPVFYINGADVQIFSCDLAGFFRKVVGMRSPAWAAAAPARVGFWSDLVEGRVSERWWDDKVGVLGCVLDDAMRKLRNGGWPEEEVEEMMLVAEKSSSGDHN